MDEFQSEKEQIEEIKQWWKANGGFIVTGLIIGVGVLGGGKYWQHYKQQKAAAASAQFEELSIAASRNDRELATDFYNKLTTDFSATPYASQAALAMAKLHVQANELDAAAEQLRKVINDSKDDNLKMVARLRLARVLIALDEPEAAIEVLAVERPGNFAARFHDVRGDVYVAMKRQEEARTEYQSALENFQPGMFDRQLVEMKLNDLTVSSASDPEA